MVSSLTFRLTGCQTLRHQLFKSIHADYTSLMAENEEELKSLLIRVKEESGKAWLKLNIQKTKVIASLHSKEKGENRSSDRFYFLGLQNHCGLWCNHENKRCLLLGRNAMTNLDSELKSRDITLLTKVCLVKAMVFSVVMYGCESWSIKKAVHWRTDAFKMWCLRRLLRVPWTARRSNQSILQEINPGYSLERLMLKLKL